MSSSQHDAKVSCKWSNLAPLVQAVSDVAPLSHCMQHRLCLNESKHDAAHDAATAIRPKINITFFTAPTASGWLFLLVDLEGLTGSCVVCYLWSWNAEYAKVWLDNWLVFLSVNRVLYTSVVYAAFNCLQHTCPCEHAITQIPLNPAVAYYGNENKE